MKALCHYRAALIRLTVVMAFGISILAALFAFGQSDSIEMY